MIRFFRKIRQKLLFKSKFSKYLMYALGEIFLITIGILIALQANNWNERRIQNSLGRSLMFELAIELENDIEFYGRMIKKIEKCIKNQERMFEVKNLQNVNLHTLYNFFSEISWNLPINTITKDKMKNLGLTVLSDNEILNKEINLYFDKHVTNFNKRIEFEYSRQKERNGYIYDQDIIPYNNQIIMGLEEIDSASVKVDFMKFLNSPRTRNTIDLIYETNKKNLEYIISYRNRFIDLLEKIHKELLKTSSEIKPLPDFTID